MKAKYFYGYNIVAASFIIQAICIGVFVTYGIFFKEFQDEFGWSRTTISGASSLGTLVLGAATILAGRLNDKIGPRAIIISSGILLGSGYLLMSFVQEPWQLFLLYGVIIGVGFSTVDVITLSTTARWFFERRGMMSGIVKIGTGVGQLVIPLIVTTLITAYGWRNSYIIIGMVLLITLPAIARVLRRDPQGIGLLPDNGNEEPDISVTSFIDPGVTLKIAIRTKQLWLISVAWFALLFCTLTIFLHIVPHAIDLGLSQTTAAGVISTIGAVSMLGRFSMGIINDRIGGKRSLIISTLIFICGLIWLQMARDAWMLFLFASIHGFAHGALYTIISLIVAELFGTKSHGVL
ncbi:MAG: MFS transporter, partial [Deltaproteobacteria bacterium]|nr:MFS transporter [Deltaproteobacteria bacterium]